MSTTDINLWDKTAVTQQPKWENRAKVISHFIRPNDTVLDLGAGDRKLRKYIPASCGYIPVDCTDKIPGTFIVDFNKAFRLPSEPFTVIVSAGFLEYIEDLNTFMRKLSSKCEGIYFLFTYSYSNGKPPKKAYEKLNGFCDAKSVTDFLRGYASDLHQIVKFKNQSLFGCSLTANPNGVISPVMTINEITKAEPFWRKWKLSSSRN
jgi:hypothetical protein